MFKVGDRVRYINNDIEDMYVGEKCTVIRNDDSTFYPYLVEFDDGERSWASKNGIELISRHTNQKFKVGDVVKVSDSNVDAYGYITTVYSDSCRVRINEHTEWGCDNSELTHSDKTFTKNFTFNPINGKITLCE